MDKLFELRKIGNKIRKLAHEAQSINPTYWCQWGIKGIDLCERVGRDENMDNETPSDSPVTGSTM